MGKKRKRKPKNARQEVLQDMISCNSTCPDVSEANIPEFESGFERLDYYLRVLPGISYIQRQLVNYIFSDGLSAGGISEDEKLNNFLYRLNAENITNYSVLRSAVSEASVYGECGIRWKDDNIYLYHAGTYAPLVRNNEGIQEVLGYVVSEKGETIVDSDFDLDKYDYINGIYSIDRYFENQGYVMLDKNDFVNLRNDPSKLHGESPLLKDELRLKLLVSTYTQLNIDIEYDGPGRIILRPRKGLVGDDANESSTSKIIGANNKGKTDKMQAEINRIAQAIKDSTPDSVIVISNGFDDEIEKLPRVTKATEFFEWLQNEGVILSTLMGLPPSLMEQGEWSGNVSMTRIIDNAMTNVIIPLRESYATQFSPMLSSHLELAKVFFQKYTLQSEESLEAKIGRATLSIQQLWPVAQNMPEAEKTIKEMLKRIDYAIHDSVGGVVELQNSIEQKEEQNEHTGSIEEGGRSKAGWRGLWKKNRNI